MRENIESFQGENLEEGEMGQILATIINEDAIARVRAKIPTGPSLINCVECGDEIPEQRRKLVAGCQHCIECKTALERR
jgi:phage/conjugal plasmid C-4 type zinc finger TraR family protein